MNRILAWFLVALIFAMSGPLQAATMASARGFEKSLYGRSAAWADKYAYCNGDPIQGSDPDGLQPRPWMMTDPMGASQPKLGRPGFKNPWDYGKVVGGMALLIPAANGAARTATLAYRGVRALGYGRAGIMAYFGAHGQELGEMVEGALLPAGHPSGAPVNLYRIVTDAELKSIRTAGKYSMGPGNEVKRFYPTLEQAQDAQKLFNKAFKENHTITSTTVKPGQLEGLEMDFAAGEGSYFTFGVENLPTGPVRIYP